MPKIKIHRSVEEILIMAASVVAASTVLPFAIYRYFHGQYTIALVEVLAVFIVASIGLLVWKTRDTTYTSTALSAFILAGLVLLNYLIDSSIFIWTYPIIMTVYFLNPAKRSALLVIPTLLALFPLMYIEKTTIEFASAIVTVIITLVFSHLVSGKIRQQNERLQNLINYDGLTGALNRRSLDDRLDLLQSLYFRHKAPGSNIVSVIIFDIDDFKMINDTRGHLEGDKILINLTKYIKKMIRKTDEFYRYGGEEFVVIVNGSNLYKAGELAEKIRAAIEETELLKDLTVTASFGVAEIQSLEESQSWLARADKALYRAKRAGKNRVYLANPEKVNDFEKDYENYKKEKSQA
ncbi:GGDEF domain-containing protein [uncultured Cocleimonas sp.]|uniref:GGDEF domain-containing protein n=1 Tax=uncultured Cocleimonas sp. TaxID=1051587 RepID=UPI002624ED09|nr:GGDEF domain-containing protein [uncultured Cocleimonas sp.]